MSIFNNRTILTLVLLLLSACQSGPDQVPTPAPAVEPAPTEQAAPVTEESAEVPAVEPVDFYQQFYIDAVDLLKSGNTEQAIELLVQVSTDAPDKPYVFTNIGLAYFKLQQMELAEQAFQAAISASKRDAVAYNHLGILQRQKGEFDNARKHYQRAIDIDPGYAFAHLNLGILYDIYLQDLPMALEQYERYQALISAEDKQVAGWIIDIQRRLKIPTKKAQG